MINRCPSLAAEVSEHTPLHYIIYDVIEKRLERSHLEGVDEVSGTGSPSKGACELFDRFL